MRCSYKRGNTRTFWTRNALNLYYYLMEIGVKKDEEVIIFSSEPERSFYYTMLLGAQGMGNVGYLVKKEDGFSKRTVPMIRQPGVFDMRAYITPSKELPPSCRELAKQYGNHPLISMEEMLGRL